MNKLYFIFQSIRRSLISWIYSVACTVICAVRSNSSKEVTDPRDFLVIQLAHFGDAVLTTPLISALGKRFPGAGIDILTGSQNVPILDNNEFVRTIYRYDSNKYCRLGGNPVVDIDFAKLSAADYDVVVYIKGDFRTLRYLLFGHYGRAAFCKAVGYRLRSTWLRIAGIRLPETRCHHYVESMFVALRKVGIDLSEYATEKSHIVVDTETTDKASNFIHSLVGEEQYVVLHCSTPFLYRNWPKEHFAALIQHIRKKWGFRCLLVGDNASRIASEDIRIATGDENVDNIAGKLGLIETLAVITGAVAYVGNDSGPLHMAGATETPCLAFYGPQLPDLFGPWHTKGKVLFKKRICSPCWQSGCLSPSRSCMTDITVEEATAVFDAIMVEEYGALKH